MLVNYHVDGHTIQQLNCQLYDVTAFYPNYVHFRVL